MKRVEERLAEISLQEDQRDSERILITHDDFDSSSVTRSEDKVENDFKISSPETRSSIKQKKNLFYSIDDDRPWSPVSTPQDSVLSAPISSDEDVEKVTKTTTFDKYLYSYFVVIIIVILE